MRNLVKMPRLGETTESVVVLEWHVGVGDRIGRDQALMQVETDKVEVEVPSPVAGVVTELLVAQDDEVSVGAAICVVES
jgi:pyruvate/2-oxoglutarate dehydrogenase complex dihydrolipoamide acyltransferase (E2) component